MQHAHVLQWRKKGERTTYSSAYPTKQLATLALVPQAIDHEIKRAAVHKCSQVELC